MDRPVHCLVWHTVQPYFLVWDTEALVADSPLASLALAHLARQDWSQEPPKDFAEEPSLAEAP